ncbi:hypothetical protein W545_02624 [Staphylococcus aureus VET0275R]|nr:hypothetical protein W545_02624 [Staphylococcus aureus VET0275R]
MATTKLGNTKSASRVINYAEERAEEKSGLNCDVDYAKSYFKQTRALCGKENGVQAHTVIQSFKPGEVTAKECNEIGLELAKKIAQIIKLQFIHIQTKTIITITLLLIQ